MIAGQHLLGIRDLTVDQIYAILDAARGFKDISRRLIKKVPSLRGRSIMTVFYEASTRTRMSFELAAKRLSADISNIQTAGSSVKKGESLLDTMQNLDAMQLDAVIIRHHDSGAPHYLANRLKARVINAGDGQHEHPTQALLDMLTIQDYFEKFEGLEVAIIGDILHSRVARSNLIGLHKLGAKLRVFGPKTLIPLGLAETYGCTVCANLEQALDGVHVAMTLRLQRERMSAGLLPDLREYAVEYGINSNRLKHIRKEGILMHPGPVNRGVELAPDVMDGERSVILEQVENGVAVRMAVMYLILGGEAHE
ncbi:MAG: aspartate carbamoyltransferase catalytic subunit [Deltaproteobacteria bacterium]|nr:aspartate carbamoyltransferase catalytic subunit [Deltaproteobacteria bacterium]